MISYCLNYKTKQKCHDKNKIKCINHDNKNKNAQDK